MDKAAWTKEIVELLNNLTMEQAMEALSFDLHEAYEQGQTPKEAIGFIRQLMQW